METRIALGIHPGPRMGWEQKTQRPPQPADGPVRQQCAGRGAVLRQPFLGARQLPRRGTVTAGCAATSRVSAQLRPSRPNFLASVSLPGFSPWVSMISSF